MASQQQNALKDSSLFKRKTEKEILESHSMQMLESVTSSSSIKNFDVPIGICKIIVEFTMISAQTARHEVKIQKAIEELLVTEERYIVDVLDHYKKNYIDALEGKTQILSKTQYDLLCPKILWNNLLDLNSLFYRQLHGECMQYTDSIIGICRVFEECMLPYLHVYDSYVHHHKSQRVSEAADQSQRFRKYDAEMTSANNSRICSGSCLVWPLSRLARYTLILREMRKHIRDESKQKIHLIQIIQRLDGKVDAHLKFRNPVDH